MIERRQRRRRGLSSTGNIGKYSLDEVIRVQPTRSLYRSYDPFLDRKVAIKIIQLFDPNGEQDDEANDAFYLEARAIGRLQHQNIVSVYDAGLGDYEGYIVMEFIEGESLLQKLKTQHTLKLNQSLKIARQICHALQYAHDKKIIHRDIKPSNIMLNKNLHVKVVDFGISLLGADSKGNQSQLTGTPSYMAPELIHGSAPSVQSDIYSLAVLIYEMILGRLPFSGEDAHAVMFKVINEEPEPITENIPDSFKRFLYKALSKQPADRFVSCSDFEDQLALLQEEIDSTSYNHVLDTEQLKQLQLFAGCKPEILHELAACLVFESADAGELLVDESLLDEYVCLVQGKALLVAIDKHIMVPNGQWLTEKVLKQQFGSYSCKALSKSLLLRVSKSNLLESSPVTQAYFFEFILDRIFTP